MEHELLLQSLESNENMTAVLVVGHSHYGGNRGSTSSTTSTLSFANKYGSFDVQESSLWTTWISYSHSNSNKTSNHPSLPLYQAFFQGLHVQNTTTTKTTTAPQPPRKTLIMESKACCGIGTTGKILSLSEIQSKQLESRPKRQQQQHMLLLSCHDDNIQWTWQGESVATSTETVNYNNKINAIHLQRTAWHWQGGDDDNDESKRMADLFPTVTQDHAMEVLEKVAMQMYQLQDVPVPTIGSSRVNKEKDDHSEQVHQSLV